MSKKIPEDKILENTQSWSLHVLERQQTTSLTLTDLQILGCELHKNAFGGRALPGPAGGAIALPQTSLPLFGERREGKGD